MIEKVLKESKVKKPKNYFYRFGFCFDAEKRRRLDDIGIFLTRQSYVVGCQGVVQLWHGVEQHFSTARTRHGKGIRKVANTPFQHPIRLTKDTHTRNV